MDGSFTCGRRAPGPVRPERADLSLSLGPVQRGDDGRPAVEALVSSKRVVKVGLSTLRVIVTDRAGRVVAGQDEMLVPLSLVVRTVGPAQPARLRVYPQGVPCAGTRWKQLWGERAGYRVMAVVSANLQANSRVDPQKVDQAPRPLLFRASMALSGPR
ncbi:hypothetical protein [Actinomadura decatromicini]|uniref:Uncharacterized protein n=1 Tax=Actinomadura decatromicini TaxID=2604572 RepID=A0A5D3FV77_9ACTN|nr:hypothetical protein [Actinomadura decatromicini]TYK51025.1 hypothetical protein FXF68_11270 [Actinomadura decatromicini]